MSHTSKLNVGQFEIRDWSLNYKKKDEIKFINLKYKKRVFRCSEILFTDKLQHIFLKLL